MACATLRRAPRAPPRRPLSALALLTLSSLRAARAAPPAIPNGGGGVSRHGAGLQPSRSPLIPRAVRAVLLNELGARAGKTPPRMFAVSKRLNQSIDLPRQARDKRVES